MKSLTIEKIEIKNLDVDLLDPFAISVGTVIQVNNLMVVLTLTDGTIGYGEIAPFPELMGENREASLNQFNQIVESLIGLSLKHIREISILLEEALSKSPAVKCGLEISMLDALSRSLGIPLWSYFGGANPGPLETDITIPILPKERSLELAGKWHSKEFGILKIKVGSDYQKEVQLISEINKQNDNLKFILDANQAFEEHEALEFLREVMARGCNVILYEQPLNRSDFQGMARLKKLINIPLAADESVSSIKDLKDVITYNTADVINLKIMKTGVFNTLKIASTALSMGLELMIGGMVETRLAMSCSVAIAMGYCKISYIDLDTPLLMSSDPFLGGYSYCGPDIMPWESPGLGIEPIFI